MKRTAHVTTGRMGSFEQQGMIDMINYTSLVRLCFLDDGYLKLEQSDHTSSSDLQPRAYVAQLAIPEPKWYDLLPFDLGNFFRAVPVELSPEDALGAALEDVLNKSWRQGYEHIISIESRQVEKSLQAIGHFNGRDNTYIHNDKLFLVESLPAYTAIVHDGEATVLGIDVQ